MPPQSSAAAEDRPLHVFIVPGSWHTLDHCTPLIQALESHSIPASAAELPTCQLSRCNIKDFQHPDLAGPRPEKPWPDMYADAAAVHASLQGLVDAGKEVILVAHSYGGMPAAEALTPDLCVEQRTARGEPGGVIGFFGMVTFFLPKGMTTTQAVGGRMPQTPEQPSGLHVCLDPEANLFNDLPAPTAAYWADKLVPQPVAVHDTPLTNTGYLNVPCAYLKTSQDKMVPLPAQEKLIEGAQGMGTKILKVYEVDAGHEPFIGQSGDVSKAIAEFAAAVKE